MSLVFLAGCGGNNSFKQDSFSNKDMCVVNIDSAKEICYGQTQTDAEKVVGTGEQGFAKNVVNYDFGISLMYRNDEVVGISINEESKGIYKTARGAEVGISKEDSKNMYSNKYAIDKATYNLDFFYDTSTNKFLGDKSLESQRIKDELEKVFVLSFMYSSDNQADRIMLLDLKMARFIE